MMGTQTFAFIFNMRGWVFDMRKHQLDDDMSLSATFLVPREAKGLQKAQLERICLATLECLTQFLRFKLRFLVPLSDRQCSAAFRLERNEFSGCE